MKLTEDIIKASILGTDKYYPQDLQGIESISQKIIAAKKDKEDAFLKIAASAFLYEEAGNSGIEGIEKLSPCPKEIKRRADDAISNQIKAAIQNKEDILFQYLVYKCNEHEMIAGSHVIPAILDKAIQLKGKQAGLLIVCGETGKWLSELNPDWNSLLQPETNEASWDTGNIENRKAFLGQLRKKIPAEAITLLENSIKQENAAVRAEFIELLEEGLSLNDEAFLQEFASDKSIKVKQAANLLLKKLNGSKLNSLYLDYASKAIIIKEERYMLISKKKVLSFNEKLVPGDDLFLSGIEKISNQKGVEDYIFWLAQVMAFTDPSSLSVALRVSEIELLNLLLESKEKAILIPWLIESAVNYKNETWAERLLQINEIADIRLLELLPESNRPKFYRKFMLNDFTGFFGLIIKNDYKPINVDLAYDIVGHLIQQPYAISQPYYQLLALHLPDQILPLLQKHSAAEENSSNKYSKNQATEMIRILELKNNLKF